MQLFFGESSQGVDCVALSPDLPTVNFLIIYMKKAWEIFTIDMNY